LKVSGCLTRNSGSYTRNSGSRRLDRSVVYHVLEMNLKLLPNAAPIPPTWPTQSRGPAENVKMSFRRLSLGPAAAQGGGQKHKAQKHESSLAPGAGCTARERRAKVCLHAGMTCIAGGRGELMPSTLNTGSTGYRPPTLHKRCPWCPACHWHGRCHCRWWVPSRSRKSCCSRQTTPRPTPASRCRPAPATCSRTARTTVVK
jgi:hypothetical protein